MRLLGRPDKGAAIIDDKNADGSASVSVSPNRRSGSRLLQVPRKKQVNSNIEESRQSGNKVEEVVSKLHLHELPTEILQQICQYMDINTALAFGATCCRARLSVAYALNDIALQEIHQRSEFEVEDTREKTHKDIDLPLVSQKIQALLAQSNKWDLKLVFWLVYLKVERHICRIDAAYTIKSEQEEYKKRGWVTIFRPYPYQRRQMQIQAGCDFMRILGGYSHGTLDLILSMFDQQRAYMQVTWETAEKNAPFALPMSTRLLTYCLLWKLSDMNVLPCD